MEASLFPVSAALFAGHFGALDFFSFASLLAWWGILFRLRLTMRKLPGLVTGQRGKRGETPLPANPSNEDLPSVYVVVPARNEERNIEKSIRSLLSLDYPDLHVVAVNDRSADGTGEILARVAGENGALHVVTVEALPDGWLGKNHACHMASLAIRRMTEGRAPDHIWILFSDGDIIHSPDSLLRSVRLALREGAGHLALLPDFIAPGILERAFTGAFGLFFLLGMRAWEVPDPKSSAFIGVGAYNLVRLDRYEIAGGHEALPFDVVDDIKLGMLLKRSGTKQILADAEGLVRVRWQEGFAATMRGLLKNFFAGYDYRWSLVLIATIGLLFLGTAPVAGLFFSESLAGTVAGGLAFLAGATVHGRAASRRTGRWIWTGLLFPFIELTLAGTLLASAWLATIRGGIDWRGTHYSLNELRRRCVRRS